MDKQKVIILEQSKLRLKELLERIEIQERKTRSTMNAIRDFVICVNKKGRIIRSNSSFDKIITAEMGPLHREDMYIGAIFPDLDPFFFLKVEPLQTIDTEIKRKNDTPIPVQVSVTSMISEYGLDDQTTAVFNTNSSVFSDIEEENDNEEAYLIVARNMTSQVKIREEQKHKENMLANLRKFEFEAQFRVSYFRKMLFKFAKQYGLHNNVLFLERCMMYRTKSIEQRVQGCKDIYDKFLKEGSEMFINISSGLSEHYRLKVSKSVGDIDLFKELEDFAKNQLICEVYEKFVDATSLDEK
jgi:hypothetical protein